MTLYANIETGEFGLTQRHVKRSVPSISFPADAPPEPWIVYTPIEQPNATLTHDPVEVFPINGRQVWEMQEVSAGEKERRLQLQEAEQEAELFRAARDRINDLQTEQMLNDPALPVEDKAVIGNAAKPWIPDEAVVVDVHRKHERILYRCIQPHTTQLGWEPPAVPALWTRAIAEGEIPAWVQPTGAHDAYALGQLVTHNSKTWRSLVDANVWEPGAVGSESLWEEVQLR